jgi:hypothetical protein
MTTIYGNLPTHLGHVLDLTKWPDGDIVLSCLECGAEVLMVIKQGPLTLEDCRCVGCGLPLVGICPECEKR